MLLILLQVIDDGYSTDKPGVLLGIFFTFALLVGALSIAVNAIGVTLVSGVSGVLIGAWILMLLEPASFVRLEYYRFIVLGCFSLLAILFGLGLGPLRKRIISVHSAMVGSYVLLVGIDYFARVGFNELLMDVLQGHKTAHLTLPQIAFIVAVPVATIIGSLVQLKTGATVEVNLFSKKKKDVYYPTINNSR